MFAWLPLLALSLLEGQAYGGAATVPFLLDVEAHVRFLVALPLLIAAELVVHRRMRTVVQVFLDRNLVPDAELPRFHAAVASTIRLRNSVVAELVLIALVYGVGVLVVWRHYVALDADTWYTASSSVGAKPSLAGMWYGFVSLPLFQFLLVRWYFRLAVWIRFLWKVSGIELRWCRRTPIASAAWGFSRARPRLRPVRDRARRAARRTARQPHLLRRARC